MVNDPVADFITRIKNASMRGLPSISLPHSKLKESIASLLEREGYIAGVSVNGKKGGKQTISLNLVYNENGNPRITSVRRVSKPSRRIYQSLNNLRPDKEGITVLSTSKGVKTLYEAREVGLGGEVLFKVR